MFYKNRNKDHSRPVLPDLVTTSHMCQSKLRGVVSVNYMLNFTDIVGKQERKLFFNNFYIDYMLN